MPVHVGAAAFDSVPPVPSPAGASSAGEGTGGYFPLQPQLFP